MTTPYSRDKHPSRLSRRRLLGLLGGAGAAALLAACGGNGGTAAPAAAPGGSAAGAPTSTATVGVPTSAAALSPTSTATVGVPTSAAALSPTSAATRGVATAATSVGSATAESGAITIPNSGVKLPTDKVNFRWIDSGDLKALFYKQYFAAYQQAHPNITIQYDALPWTEIEKIVPLGVQNGNAHDAFAVPLNVPGAQAVREGWVAPLDEVVPNFQRWKDAFPFGSFIDGVHVFNGKTYTFPVTSNKRYGTLTLYNTDIMQRAGYDLASKPFTWDEMRAAAKKITEQGKGQYYGTILGAKSTQRLAEFVRNLGRMAGAPASGGSPGNESIDWKTGQYIFTSDQYLAAIDLLLALNADGSVFPGSLSLDETAARSRMPQGVAGFIIEGPWNIPQWPRENPDFKFGVASTPLPNSGAPLPLTFEETGANQMWVYAKSPNKAIAGDMFAYTGSEDGQTAIVVATEGNLRALLPKANERAQQSKQLDPHASKALALYEQQIRTGPLPVVRNPDVAQVLLELKNVTPDFGQTIQGLFVGQLKDPKAAMRDLTDRMDKELERAIKAAQAKGAKVSRDDWKLANWDPAKDYSKADYDAAK